MDELLRIAVAIARGELPPYQHHECVTVGAFDGMLVDLHGAEAFQLLQAMCDRFDAVDASGPDLTGYFDVIALLAGRSDTTEMPRGLEAIMARHPGHSGALRAWYRRQGQLSI